MIPAILHSGLGCRVVSDADGRPGVFGGGGEGEKHWDLNLFRDQRLSQTNEANCRLWAGDGRCSPLRAADRERCNYLKAAVGRRGAD